MKIEPGMLVSLWESRDSYSRRADIVIVGSIDLMVGHEFPAGTLAIIVEKRWPRAPRNVPDEWVVLIGTHKGWVYGADCKSPSYKPRRKKL